MLPANLATTNYSFGSFDFGDAVECAFTNSALPHISLEKQLSTDGRINDTDQFRMRIRKASGNLRAITTSGAGDTVTNGNTGMRQAIAGDPYRIDERARGTTDLSRYTAAVTCTNAFAGSATVLPTAQNVVFTPGPGNVSFDGTSPVIFAEGATLSDLDPFDPALMVSFSAQPGGVAPYTRLVASGYDSAVTGVLIEPEGILAASDGTNHPGFSVSLPARVE